MGPEATMGEKRQLSDLTDDERARLLHREVISKDDPTAYCNGPAPEGRSEAPAVPVPDVPNARAWRATLETPIEGKHGTISIECERYNDAKSFAGLVAGGLEVAVVAADGFDEVRWQVRWEGSALDPHDPPHLSARIMGDDGRAQTKWKNLRDIVFT